MIHFILSLIRQNDPLVHILYIHKMQNYCVKLYSMFSSYYNVAQTKQLTGFSIPNVGLLVLLCAEGLCTVKGCLLCNLENRFTMAWQKNLF